MDEEKTPRRRLTEDTRFWIWMTILVMCVFMVTFTLLILEPILGTLFMENLVKEFAQIRASWTPTPTPSP